jgi:hypothetical protein
MKFRDGLRIYHTHHRILGRIWMWLGRRRGYVTKLENFYRYSTDPLWPRYRTRYSFTAERKP